MCCISYYITNLNLIWRNYTVTFNIHAHFFSNITALFNAVLYLCRASGVMNAPDCDLHISTRTVEQSCYYRHWVVASVLAMELSIVLRIEAAVYYSRRLQLPVNRTNRSRHPCFPATYLSTYNVIPIVLLKYPWCSY